MRNNVIDLDAMRDPKPVRYQIDPWGLAIVISGWLWAGIWYVASLAWALI